MRKKVVKSLVYAQLSFLGCLFIDVLITAKGFTNNRGLSFYGAHLRTVIPFALGFMLCDVFLLRAAKMLPKLGPAFRSFRLPLRVLVALLSLIVLTPYSLNSLFYTMHTLSSLTLFIFELALSLWLIVRWCNTKLSWVLFSGQFLAGVVAGLSEIQLTRYLSEATLFYQLIFSSLIIWTMLNVLKPEYEVEDN